METKIMAAVINDNVIDKVVGRTKKEKVKPKEFGADDFHSIAPDQMKQILRGLNDVLQIVETLDISEATYTLKSKIKAIEDTLCQKLKQIEDPESQEIKDEELLRQLIEMQRASQNNGQTWINTSPGTVTAPYVQPYGTGGGGGSGGSGDIIWRTMDSTTTAIPQFTSDDEEIPDLRGLLPTSSDDY